MGNFSFHVKMERGRPRELFVLRFPCTAAPDLLIFIKKREKNADNFLGGNYFKKITTMVISKVKNLRKKENNTCIQAFKT